MVGASRRAGHGGLVTPPAVGNFRFRRAADTIAPPALAHGGLPLRPRGQDKCSRARRPSHHGRRGGASAPTRALGARWRVEVGQELARFAPGGGPDRAAARFLRNWSVADATADRYDGQWRAFAAYCHNRGVPPLPASISTIVDYIGREWNRGAIVAITLKPMLAAIRKRHLAAGFENPCDDDAVREAKAGFRRAGLALRRQHKPRRIPLPSAVTWRLALLATYSPRALRHRLTAVVAQFWWMRRAGDITRLRVQDLEFPADGRVCYQVLDHKTAAADGLLARSLPAAVDPATDVPRLLQKQLLEDKRSAGAPPTSRLFSRCAPEDARDTMTAWLRDGLARLGVQAPVGTSFSSHSLKRGGATSANAAGVGRGAIAEFANTSEQTLAASYISALAVPTCYDRYFLGRLLPA